MPSSLRAVSVAVLFLLSGACTRMERPLEEGWPEKLDFSRLPRHAQQESQSQENLPRLERLGDERTYSRTYPQQGPFHGILPVVTIIYLPERDEFYVQGDCMMGHFDAPYGPFDGDPRTVLATPAP
jgi:hypothetical protein